MRLIQVIPGLITESSGPTYCLLRLVEALRLYNCHSQIVALDLPGTVHTSEDLKTFPVTLGMRRLGVSVAMRKWLRAEAGANRMHVMHSHSLWMMPNVYPGPISRRFTIPLVISPHGTLSDWAFGHGSRLKPAFWHLLQRATLEQATVIHATSDMEAAEVRSRGLRAPIAVVPNGIDVPPHNKLSTKSTRPTVGYLGRIHPKKGIDTLLKVWSRLEGEFADWDLAIAGPDQHEYAAQMKRLACELGLKRVRFHGELVGESKSTFLREASLTVLPTHSENFGVSVAESLANATPAIVTRGAPWEGLQTNRAGWWIDHGTEALEAALSEAMRCPSDELARRGMAGREWMDRDFSWTRVAAMMAKTYRWMLGECERPAWVVT